MILLSPPPRGRVARRWHPQNSPRFSPQSTPVPYFCRSRRRMDHERVGPGGRKASWPRRNVRRVPGGGGGRRAPLAAWSSIAMTGPSQPPDQPSHPGFAHGRSKRMDGGTGLWRIVWPEMATEFASDAFHSLPWWPRPGRAARQGDACRMRTSSGEFRAARVDAPPPCMF